MKNPKCLLGQHEPVIMDGDTELFVCQCNRCGCELPLPEMDSTTEEILEDAQKSLWKGVISGVAVTIVMFAVFIALVLAIKQYMQ